MFSCFVCVSLLVSYVTIIVIGSAPFFISSINLVILWSTRMIWCAKCCMSARMSIATPPRYMPVCCSFLAHICRADDVFILYPFLLSSTSCDISVSFMASICIFCLRSARITSFWLTSVMRLSRFIPSIDSVLIHLAQLARSAYFSVRCAVFVLLFSASCVYLWFSFWYFPRFASSRINVCP